MAKATMKTRQEIIDRHRQKYGKSTKAGKGAILDSVCMDTGLSRSRAKHLLSGKPAPRRKNTGRRGRRPKYGGKAVEALAKIWAYMDFAGGKRLAAGISEMMDALARFGELDIDDETAALLRQMSPSTIDRKLSHEKKRMRFKGVSTTKPGTLLKRDIPVRLGTEWDDAMPGFMEIDLVAHCGTTAAGEYINTLDATDVFTGWTETQAAINKAQKHVFGALKEIEGRMPFALRGIDSDNGSEFINGELYRYCRENRVCFTRSRPYMKNDSCHVEQKNWHLVRRNIGYGRYEGEEALAVMNEYYSLLRLHSNFFMPHMKLIGKERAGARVIKRYDCPKTPYRRLLDAGCLSDLETKQLAETYRSINPAQLKRDMIRLMGALAELELRP